MPERLQEFLCKGTHPDFDGQRCAKRIIVDHYLQPGSWVTLPPCPRCRTINTVQAPSAPVIGLSSGPAGSGGRLGG